MSDTPVGAVRHSGAERTAASLADALDCFWNAAIGDARRTEDATALAVASCLAEGFSAVARRLREDYKAEDLASEAPAPQPTHRHKKRGSTYTVIGIGRMQADHWRDPNLDAEYDNTDVDMREVVIYRATDDGSLWARPLEEFDDGRFEEIPATPSGQSSPVPSYDKGLRRAGETAAARDVLAERRRQVEVEGWTPEHDDQHLSGEMATAGGLYALNVGHVGILLKDRFAGVPKAWPWERSWWKPKDRRGDLVRAGALIIAEIERLDRAALLATEEGQ